MSAEEDIIKGLLNALEQLKSERAALMEVARAAQRIQEVFPHWTRERGRIASTLLKSALAALPPEIRKELDAK